MQFKFILIILSVLLINADAEMKYMVDTPVCKIPDFGQWPPNEIYNPKKYVPCKKDDHLLKVNKIDDLYFVVVDEQVMLNYTNVTEEISCWISNITRGTQSEMPDKEIRESNPQMFDTPTKTEVLRDVIRAKCYQIKNNKAKLIYENIFGTYVPYNIINRKRPLAREPFNVLMIAIESLSKYAFRQLLPKTFRYITENDFHLIKGYGQIGNDALSNIIPMMTGYSLEDAVIKYGSPIDTFFDVYNLVWYDYEKYGYATSFAEDFGAINTFNRENKGFWSQPTNYYFRAMTLALELMNMTYLNGMPHCVGLENEAEKILALALDITTAFRNRPYFGFFYLNSFSHNSYNAPSRMDVKLTEFFKKLGPNLNDTVVIFFSDHGYSSSKLVERRQGHYESISPFNFVHVPSRFRSKYPELVLEFEDNLERVVSPFDVYATLQDLLVLSDTNHAPKMSHSCPTATSLFRDMPKKRSCFHAGLPPGSCVCWLGRYGSPQVRSPAEQPQKGRPVKGHRTTEVEDKPKSRAASWGLSWWTAMGMGIGVWWCGVF